MFDLSAGVWLIVGFGLLSAALAGALKVGLWFWFLSRLTGQQPQRPSPRASSEGGVMKWLTVIATVLGIISTSVGLLEKCGGSSPTPAVQTQPYTTPTTNTIGYRCCTSMGACPMIMGGQAVGSVCTCMGMAGYVQGRVCQ